MYQHESDTKTSKIGVPCTTEKIYIVLYANTFNRQFFGSNIIAYHYKPSRFLNIFTIFTFHLLSGTDFISFKQKFDFGIYFLTLMKYTKHNVKAKFIANPNL